MSSFDVGVLRTTLLPNLQFHTALAVPAYLVARITNRVEVKDYLWASGQLLNALYTSLGPSLRNGDSLGRALDRLSRPQAILLAGVSLWATRLTYRAVSRRIKSSDHDDARYEELKRDQSAWNTSIPLQFLTEAVLQALIALPFTVPFRSGVYNVGLKPEYAGYAEALAIGLWSAGFALEVLADTHLAHHQSQGRSGLVRTGVWSIVRHPNYLGDLLQSISYPLFLFSTTLFNPVTLLGPLTNWIFLRFLGGDAQTEQSQEERYNREDPLKRVELAEYRDEKNAFWPGLSELGNVWTWVVIGAGAAGVVGVRWATEAARRL